MALMMLHTEVEQQLGEYERAVMSEIETSGDKLQYTNIKHLIVGGNVFQVGRIKTVIHLDSYVVSQHQW